MLTLSFSHRKAVTVVAGAAIAMLGVLAFGPSFARAATWSIQTTPNAEGAEHSSSYDIGCPPSGLSICYSAGKKVVKGVSSPYAQRWNGSSWANESPAVPAESTGGELQAVDCAAPFAGIQICNAAGSYSTAGGTFSLVESRGSSSWNVSSTPNPAGASETKLKGIDCSGALVCKVVGYSVVSGEKTAIAISGVASWTIQAIPAPAGAKSTELHGVECTASNACVAVGSYVNSEGVEWAMALSYNGTEWSQMTMAKPAESKGSILLDISCASANACAAVGGYRNSKNVQVSFVVRWNGTAWSHQASPNPALSNNTVFQNVSCTEGSLCVAVGDWRNGSNVWQPMAQQWNGSEWVLDTTPTPTGATFSLLEGAACRGETCLGVGWYTNSEGQNRTLGETR